MTKPTRRAPLSADLLPASGAWRVGDPVGDRRFVDVTPGRPFALEGGGVLRGVTVAYETWGTLAPDASNAVLICHALTGDSHAAGELVVGRSAEGWWNRLIGPGRAVDTDELFVVCVNVLGGCQGSTGPSSIDPATGRPYGSTFPTITIRDIVRTQEAVADALGIQRWLAVIGGSMGGMQALEWAIMYPDRVGGLVAIATTAAASAQQIAYSSVQRSAIVLDPNWNGGDYYDAAPGEGPHQGLAVAREMAHITYRAESEFAERFDRKEFDQLDNGFTAWQRFQVETYLDNQGAKLARRFDANSYLAIARAMDLHDIGRGRAGVERALARITAPVLTMAIDSDALYPPYQQELLRDLIGANGGSVVHGVIQCAEGHDGFLTRADQVGDAVAPFLADLRTDHETSIR
jgi:homoserine O-acetyltransferase